MPTAAKSVQLRRESGMASSGPLEGGIGIGSSAPSLRTVLSFAAAVSTSQQRCRGGVAPPSLSSQEAWLLGVRLPEGGDGGTAFPDGLLCVSAVRRLSCFALRRLSALLLLCMAQHG